MMKQIFRQLFFVIVLAGSLLTPSAPVVAQSNVTYVRQQSATLEKLERQLEEYPDMTFAYLGDQMLGRNRWPIEEKLWNVVNDLGLNVGSIYKVRQLNYMKVFASEDPKGRDLMRKYLEEWPKANKEAHLLFKGKAKGVAVTCYAVTDNAGNPQKMVLLTIPEDGRSGKSSLVVCGL